MLRSSFRLLARTLCPSPGAGKPTAAAGALAALAILAGCGGSGGGEARVVGGEGFTFEAPAGWRVARDARTVSVMQGAAVVRVERFPLARTYTPALFDAAQREVDARARELAKQLGAEVSGSRIVDVADERAWQYDLTHEGFHEQLTFVLRGKVEFQLYCRRAVDGDDGPCRRLVATFRPS